MDKRQVILLFIHAHTKSSTKIKRKEMFINRHSNIAQTKIIKLKQI